MDWGSLENIKLIFEIIVGLSAGLGAICGVVKLSSKKTRTFTKRLFNAMESIEKIKAEFMPNGGSSLKDAINRLEKTTLFLEHSRKLQFSKADYGVCFCDATGKVLDLNRKFYEMTGLSRDQCLNTGWYLAVETNSDRECIRIALEDAINDQRETEVSFRMNGKTVSQHYFPIINRNSVIEAFMVATEDFLLKKS